MGRRKFPLPVLEEIIASLKVIACYFWEHFGVCMLIEKKKY